MKHCVALRCVTRHARRPEYIHLNETQLPVSLSSPSIRRSAAERIAAFKATGSTGRATVPASLCPGRFNYRDHLRPGNSSSFASFFLQRTFIVLALFRVLLSVPVSPFIPLPCTPFRPCHGGDSNSIAIAEKPITAQRAEA